MTSVPPSAAETATTASRGLATREGYDLPAAVLASWDAFLALVDAADLSTKTRLPGWTVREIAVHLGTWDGVNSLTVALDSAKQGGAGKPIDVDADNAQVVAAHRGASDDEVREALRASRDTCKTFLGSADAREHGNDPAMTLLGRLPLLTLVHAGCYELAVHALDVARATSQVVDERLLAAGVAALADSTGALAAREGIATTVALVGGPTGWAFTTQKDGSWTMAPATHDTKGPKLTASCVDLLEAASGRANAPLLVARRRIRISDIPGLLTLLPIVDKVPNIPGGATLKVAARSLGGLGGIFGKLGRKH